MNPKIEMRKGVASIKRQTIAFVLDQIHFWVQIPYWALQANGRDGWSQACTEAYSLRRWDVFNDRNVFVDLKTGKIVDLNGRVITDTEAILRIASDLECVDAQTILVGLKIQAKKKTAPYMNKKEVEEIRKRDQEQYGVVRVR